MRTLKPEEYVYLRAWGYDLGSYPYYIKDQQARAARDKAPKTAVYYNEDEGWVVLKDCHKDTQKRIKFLVQFLAEVDRAKQYKLSRRA